MILGEYTQAPEDDERYSIDYSQWLDEGELLDTISIEVEPLTSPPLEVHDDALTNTQDGLTYYVTGGQAGSSYTVKIKADTNGGPDGVARSRTDCVLYEIKEGC